MNNKVFERIKQNVDIKTAAENYGLVFRQNKCKCPFYAENTASFSIDEKEQYFYCFGCQTGGDVVRLTELLFHISPMQAAKKLNDDFNLGIDFENSAEKQATPTRREPTTAETQRAFEEWTKKTWLSLNSLFKFLKAYKENLSADSPKHSEISADFAIIDYISELFMKDTDGIIAVYQCHRGDIRRFYAKYQQYLPNREK